MEALVLLLGGFGIMSISAVWHGYVLTKLWAWFIVPIFHLPVLTIAPAIGIVIVLNFLTKTDTSDLKKEDDGKETFFKRVFGSFVQSLFTLIIGWIVTLFM